MAESSNDDSKSDGKKQNVRVCPLTADSTLSISPLQSGQSSLNILQRGGGGRADCNGWQRQNKEVQTAQSELIIPEHAYGNKKHTLKSNPVTLCRRQDCLWRGLSRPRVEVKPRIKLLVQRKVLDNVLVDCAPLLSWRRIRLIFGWRTKIICFIFYWSIICYSVRVNYIQKFQIVRYSCFENLISCPFHFLMEIIYDIYNHTNQNRKKKISRFLE